MTEVEWLACADPEPMLEFVRGKASERRLRLFAVACCRRIWSRFVDVRSRKGVEVSELYADGLVSTVEFERARRAARIPWWDSLDAYSDAIQAAYATARAERRPSAEALSENQRQQCALVREIIGNPLRPPSLKHSWLDWNDGTIRKMAQIIYDDRAFDRLPLLADALEEAGCDNREILDHCRSGGEHVRGCWVVDLLLGKS